MITSQPTPARAVRLVHLSSRPPDGGTVTRVRAAPVPNTLALAVVVAPEDDNVELVSIERLPRGPLTKVRHRHIPKIAETLRDLVAAAPGVVVLAVVDRVTQLAAWELLDANDDLIATNSLDSALRVIQMLERGMSPDRIKHPPPFDVALSVSDAGFGLPATATSTITVIDRSSEGGGRWIALEDGVDLAVSTGSMSHRAATAVASMAGARRRVPATAERRLVVGPANYAGQAYEWVRSVREHANGWSARNFHVTSNRAALAFRADLPLTAAQWQNPAARVSLAVELLADATDVMVEAMRPLLAVSDPSESANGWDPLRGREDVDALCATGRRVGLLFHGSEVRRPAHHLRLTASSPFYQRGNEDLTSRLIEVTDRVHEALEGFEGPVLVSTPDLLDHLPDAVWLPGVVGSASFEPNPPALDGGRPVVVHAPSRSALKGSEWIDPVLQQFDDRGLIHYKRLHQLPPLMIPSVLAKADVVVDQVVMGNPGVLAAQAMAAGRLVVAHLPEGVRRRMNPQPPVVEATPTTLEHALWSIVENPDHYGRLAASGIEFARRYHDGRMSARVLTEAFGR